MSQTRRAAGSAANAADASGAVRRPRLARRARQRADLLSDSPSAKVQRMLVLAERFRALASLRADPARLIDILRSIGLLARETFGTGVSLDWSARTVVHMAPEQQRCVGDLERLMQGLAYGSPEAWSGLGHAMDALLIQCMLFEAPAGDAAAPREP
jgi:hypothetical protein